MLCRQNCCPSDAPRSKLLSTNTKSTYTEPAAGTATVGTDEADQSCFWLTIWLQVCGHCDSEFWRWRILIVLVITVATIFDMYKAIREEWYHLFNQSFWALTTYYTVYTLRRNLSSIDLGAARFNKKEFNICCMLFAIMMASIKAAPYFTKHVCPGSNETLEVVSTFASLIVNVLSMYTFDVVLLCLCLAKVDNYNTFEAVLTEGNTNQDRQRAALPIDNVRRRYFTLRSDIESFKNDWERVVSISFFYHVLYVVVSTGIWVTYTSNNVWINCNEDQWAQLAIVIVRGCARVLGLLYGIIRLNRKPQKLAEALSRYSDWDDVEQQAAISRLHDDIQSHPVRFSVMSVNVELVHFGRILCSAMIAAAGTLLKSKLASL